MDFSNTIIVPGAPDLPLWWEFSKDFLVPVVLPIATFFLGLKISDRKEEKKFKEHLENIKTSFICEVENIIEDSEQYRKEIILYTRNDRQKNATSSQFKYITVDVSELKKLEKKDLTQVVCSCNKQKFIHNRKLVAKIYQTLKHFENCCETVRELMSSYNQGLEKNIDEYNIAISNLYVEIYKTIGSKNSSVSEAKVKNDIQEIFYFYCNTYENSSDPDLVGPYLLNRLLEIKKNPSINDLYEKILACSLVIKQDSAIRKYHTAALRHQAQYLGRIRSSFVNILEVVK